MHPAFFIHFIMLGCVVSTFFIQIYDDDDDDDDDDDEIWHSGSKADMHVVDGDSILRSAEGMRSSVTSVAEPVYR